MIPKHAKIDYGRARRTIVGTETELDTVSYDENVTKMLELFSNGDGITPVLVILSKATYNGRRKQFQNCELSTIVQDVVKNVCPLLQFQPFVS
ncbi:Uncharacterized protein APZ42_034158 [Daphnia magna]|uniref:Uncharacterized protein n=1 Tax=Daphnia magna TaxID=35525 RepID=A0A164KDX9_9CRUS|nr:Uncharacterized protein APZ42_034158 [Daphnia magna]